MNPGSLGTQAYSQSVAYSEPWNIEKFDGFEILIRHIVKYLENSSRLLLFFQDAPYETVLDV